ncbi:hypothetical protein FOB72_05665 [Cupriavidus pauculus]|uniref:Uncharacterized protein n=1 Tax=Cupriavidus pauculus TaxID=82633 RepID=A0A5P2H2G7_9BURK|nr:hypothetical protein [Cupriavidus pauculus]QET01579.1 hypothetical protein FOB72_05665 [Cupriavidus pauculus]
MRPDAMRAALFALIVMVLAVLPTASHGEACLYETEAATDPYLCVPDDGILRARHARLPKAPGHYPIGKIEVAPGSVAYVSDEETFDGAIWALRGTLGESALQARGMTPASATVLAVFPAACFYRGTRLRSKRLCFPPGPLRTYTPDLFAFASSMRIPSQLTVNAFTDFRGRGAMATFRGSLDGKALQRADMLQRIRSVHVARMKPPPVLGPVVIPAGDAYDLASIFGPHMFPGNGNPYVMMLFDADPGRDIEVTYGARISVRMRKQSAVARMLDPIAPMASLPSDKRTRYYAFTMELRPGHTASVMVMQLSAEYALIGATPWLDVPWDEPVDAVLSVRNASFAKAVRLENLLFEVGPFHDRGVRAAHCERIALKQCHDAANDTTNDSANDSTTEPSQPIAPLPVPPTQTALPRSPLPLAPPPADALLLTNIGLNGNPMAVAAAQRACRIPLMSGRRPLGLPGKDYCVSRAMTIVTMYQVLYEDLWRLDAFTAVIDNILARGTTGLRTMDASAEQTLIEAVRWQTGPQDTRRAEALAAFHHANLVRAYSVARTMNMEGATAMGHAGETSASGICGGVKRSIAALRWAALGRYDLDLTRYAPMDVRPRVRRNGKWTEADDAFEVTEVQAGQMGRQRQVIDIAHTWQREYLLAMRPDALRTALADDCPDSDGYTVRDFLASTGLSAAMGIEAAVRDDDGEENVVMLVRYRGVPAAMLLGTIPRHGSLEAEITLMVSAPANVLPPHGDGAVRGAGSAALQAFLRYCQARGMTAVRVEAVTEPSATIHQRAGFRLLDDLAEVRTEPPV